MDRPRLYKENNVWYCIFRDFKAQGDTPIEAFLNLILHKASSNLHPDETLP